MEELLSNFASVNLRNLSSYNVWQCSSQTYYVALVTPMPLCSLPLLLNFAVKECIRPTIVLFALTLLDRPIYCIYMTVGNPRMHLRFRYFAFSLFRDSHLFTTIICKLQGKYFVHCYSNSERWQCSDIIDGTKYNATFLIISSSYCLSDIGFGTKVVVCKMNGNFLWMRNPLKSNPQNVVHIKWRKIISVLYFSKCLYYLWSFYYLWSLHTQK